MSTLYSFPDHQVPPPLGQFAAEWPDVDYNQNLEEIYLYHGTNCYRRWEINKTGFIEPGRNHYSFFCTNPVDAYTYARASSMRDINPDSVNSLVLEPVVLKVRFTARTWLQVDFFKIANPSDVPFADSKASAYLSVAVLGPIVSSNIVDVLHCTHGRRLGCALESIQTFADGTFLESIRHLKEKLQKKRLDGWLLKKVGGMHQSMAVKLAGGEVPELTSDDHLRKLRQSQLRA